MCYLTLHNMELAKNNFSNKIKIIKPKRILKLDIKCVGILVKVIKIIKINKNQ